MMKIKLNKLIFSLVGAAVLVLCACNEPIFYTISQEVAPIEPRIKGGPTNFTVFERNGEKVLYVASGNALHWYREGKWNRRISDTPRPGGWIKMLASTDDYLYALCLRSRDSPGSAVVKRIGKSETKWTELERNSGGLSMQSIYAASGHPILFIGAGNYNSFGIFYVDETVSNGTTMQQLHALSGTPEEHPLDNDLCGAAFNGTNYFLATKSRYIYTAPQTFFDPIPAGTITALEKSVNQGFIGIISLADGVPSTVVAVDRRGRVYPVTNTEINDEIASMGQLATSALALWQDPIKPDWKLLLLGRQNTLTYTTTSAYTYGYMELDLNSQGSIHSSSDFREPGRFTPTTANDNDRFKSTIGKNSVNHIFQTPLDVDSTMRLFASTQKNGVWSFRTRSGKPQWNAED